MSCACLTIVADKRVIYGDSGLCSADKLNYRDTEQRLSVMLLVA